MKFKQVLAPCRASVRHPNQGYKEICASTWNSRPKIFPWMYSLKIEKKKKKKSKKWMNKCTARIIFFFKSQ